MKLFGGYKKSKYSKNTSSSAVPAGNREAYQRKNGSDLLNEKQATVHKDAADIYTVGPGTAGERFADDKPAGGAAQREGTGRKADWEEILDRNPEKHAAYMNTPKRKRKKSKKRKRRNRLIGLSVTAAILVCLYCVAMFSQIPFIVKWRNIYIDSALVTMHVKQLTFFIPKFLVDERKALRESAGLESVGINSQGVPTIQPGKESDPSVATQDPEDDPGEAFYQVFWELDRNSMETYLRNHPETLSNGYENIYINEAGLDDNGTSIYTTMGEQVLAIDAANGILLVRVSGDTFRGVLAIGKNPEQLHLYPSSGIGSYGQTVGTIASNHNGLLAITGSGFMDENGGGNGGTLAGYCKCDGVEYGNHSGWGFKRIELRENNWFYITDAPYSCDEDVTDAVEFLPALVIDGKEQPVGVYTELNPRACIGQSTKGEILMLVTEGRQPGYSLGCSATECTKILLRHDCWVGMNLDGGTSAIMWFDGEPVTRCNNRALPGGRYLPNAWVYTRAEE